MQSVIDGPGRPFDPTIGQGRVYQPRGVKPQMGIDPYEYDQGVDPALKGITPVLSIFNRQRPIVNAINYPFREVYPTGINKFVGTPGMFETHAPALNGFYGNENNDIIGVNLVVSEQNQPYIHTILPTGNLIGNGFFEGPTYDNQGNTVYNSNDLTRNSVQNVPIVHNIAGESAGRRTLGQGFRNVISKNQWYRLNEIPETQKVNLSNDMHGISDREDMLTRNGPSGILTRRMGGGISKPGEIGLVRVTDGTSGIPSMDLHTHMTPYMSKVMYDPDYGLSSTRRE